MIKACIFDLDGTLLRTQESIARPVNKTLVHFGLQPQPVEKYNYFAGDGLETCLQRALKAAGDTNAEHLKEGMPLCRAWFAEDPLYQVEPYPGITDLLGELKNYKIRIAVLSNKPHNEAVKVIETVFGRGYFNCILGQSERIPKKPDPAGAWELLQIMQVARDECLYLGDTDTDMQTGHNAGLYTIGVTWGFRSREELEKNHADRIIDHPMNVIKQNLYKL